MNEIVQSMTAEINPPSKASLIVIASLWLLKASMKRVIGTASVSFLQSDGPRQDVLTKALSGAKTMSILLIKVAAATAIVLGLSVLAERLGPRLAGVLMGAPLGALISYYFIGREAGPEFVAAGTPYAAAGMTGTLMFTYAYYRTSSLVHK